MGKTEVKIKVKGSAAGVRKALKQITAEDMEPAGPVLRECDFRTKANGKNISHN